ncbi:hypothetical protein CK203_025146 [Vitis vinifera]|uniref:Retrotransposon gag domain-containing protein n=1 Tax=Vitis vinifera TaxID=29760 RepID=A0A438JF58_VITVI|nr:hypothetical protein CK203_025146 [Vitis vinifera]
MTIMPLEWDNIPPRRPISSQNSQANNDVPHPLEGLPPMNVEGLYRSPYFSGTLDPTEAEVWILKIEKFFDVIDCSEKQKASCAAFMLDKEANHWWRVVDRALIAEKDNKELQQYREQQRKRSKSDGAHDNQEPKMFSSIESHIKGELVQNLDVTCSICENKKFIIGKPKKENKMDKQKPRVQGWMFATTHQDTQATSDVAIGKVVKGFMPMWCEMEKILCSIIVQLIKV